MSHAVQVMPESVEVRDVSERACGKIGRIVFHVNFMSAQNLRIGWIGFHQEGVPALRGLKDAGVRLEAIITLADDQLSRRSAGTNYEDLLSGWDVAVHKVVDINAPDAVALLKSLQLDLLLVIGWSQILRPEALSAARIGAVGAHASLLPHNRGSAPINWALIRGESTTGNTLIWLSDGVDEGRIIDQMEFVISPYDTCETLYEKVAQSNHLMIQRLLPRLFAGEVPGEAQRHSDEPVLPRRRPADGLLNWNQPAVQIYNFVRALTRPYPGAFSFLEGRRWLIQSCALMPDHGQWNHQAGCILGAVCSPVAEACGLLVACGQGAIVILELEDSEGKVLKGRQLSDLAWMGKVWSDE